MTPLELFASEYRVIAQDVIAYSLAIVALIWGGTPERIVAATWMICFELAAYLQDIFVGEGLQLVQIDILWASFDMAAGVSFIAVALYANRNYTLWIAAMQVLAMSAHLARGLAEAISPIGYMVMVVAPGWFQLLFFAIGLTRHIRRKREFGNYRDWRIRRGSGRLNVPSVQVSELAKTTWRDEIK